MIIAADNLNILDPDISRAVENRNPVPIQQMIRRCVADGARAIDINSGPLAKEPEKRFAFLVEAAQEVTTHCLLLDTTNPAALAAGLAVCKNPVIINGFSLEPSRLERILPLVRKYDSDIVG